jgi:lipid-A-disaccharide synthase
MKYYIISGEASGDLHASNLMKEIIKNDQLADFRCWGGDKMKAEGAELVKHYKDLAFMGFVEVLLNLKTILGNIKFCKEDIEKYKPDVILLVDYPGFNLRIAEFAKKNGYKVIYYISPQIWAWKKGRVHKIKKYVDKMMVILPFEKDFYGNYNFHVDFVGHPLLDEIEGFQGIGFEKLQQAYALNMKPVIALLPGSRKQEISRMLKIMLGIAKDFQNYQFVVAGSNSIDESFYRQYINDDQVKIIFGKTYDLLQIADAALVTSGTATLETALFEVPEVVCYKASYISYRIAKSVIKIPYISLVNLIANKQIVTELIQFDLTALNLKTELQDLLHNQERKTELQKDYRELKLKLGGIGASKKAAKVINDYLND